MPNRIEDYGIIGNMRSCALVSRGGSIDWFCAPRFDSDAVFAGLVGADQHGRYSLRPASPVRESRQHYRDETLVLETEFVCESGAFRIIDFMALEEGRTDLIRILEGLDGKASVELVLQPVFAYGKSQPWITLDQRGATLRAGPDGLRFTTPIHLDQNKWAVEAIATLGKGDRLPLCLTWFPSYLSAPEPLDAERSLAATEAYWREWSGRSAYRGRWRDPVLRSLLTLKALSCAPTGGIVAAPTTSLPECLGGVRNWDYRFCWLRDATLTLQALMVGGYAEEANAFRNWLVRAAAGHPAELQIMYGIAGERRLPEIELDWLPGYESSKPVRIGNDASRQFQLDVYGETLAALYHAEEMEMGARDPEADRQLLAIMNFLEDAWQLPDDGIWEVRGGRKHFTHSKVMAWVAVDRAVRSVEDYGIGGDATLARVGHWRALRERIHEDVCSRGFNKRVGAFTQYYGGDALDASVLVIPEFGFLPASDPRMLSTVRAIERDLLRDGFVLRYATEAGVDGLPGSEAAFLACTFWLADNYTLAGRLDEAVAVIERLLAIRNHLGLLSEEYEPRAGRQLGNFPQGFSHLALVVSAFLLSSEEARQRVQAGSSATSAAVH